MMPKMKKSRPSLVQFTLFAIVMYTATLAFQFIYISKHFQSDEHTSNHHAPAIASGGEHRALTYFRTEMVELSKVLTMLDSGNDLLGEAERFRGYLECLRNTLQKEFPIASLAKAIEEDETAFRSKWSHMGMNIAVRHNATLNATGTSHLRNTQRVVSTSKAVSTSSDPKRQLPVWHNFDFNRMHDHYNCTDHADNPNKTLTSPESWLKMRELYWTFVGLPDAAYCKAGPNDFKPPYHAQIAPGKGRGIFASRDIRINETVHSSWGTAAFFQNGDTWRRFVMTLPTPELSCDAMEWTWMQRVSRLENLTNYFGAKLVLCFGMDDGSLMNDGNQWDDEGNIIDDVPPNYTVRSKSMASLEFVANRDIRKGEEITYDYDKFYTDYAKFGL